MTKIAKIEFQGQYLNVYGTFDRPYFTATDIARVIDYSMGKTHEMLKLVEDDEKFMADGIPATKRGGNHNPVWMVTEMGLYSILSQSRKPIARMWRRVAHQQLIEMRIKRNLSIQDQFDEWDDLLDTLYIDPETGILMQSVTVEGGDVEQVPYVE